MQFGIERGKRKAIFRYGLMDLVDRPSKVLQLLTT